MERASLKGSSYYRLPQPLRWFSGEIGLHHVHHYAQQIPNYRLAEALEAVPKLSAVKPLTLSGSLRCWDLKLWDEEQGKLVGFPERRPVPAALAEPAPHLSGRG